MAAPVNTVTIGEKDYPFKKINLTIFKEHLEFLKKNAERQAGVAPPAGEALDGLIEMAAIIHKCIRRAQPDVKLEEIMDGLDEDNVGQIFAKVMTSSSMVAPGEGAPTEAKA